MTISSKKESDVTLKRYKERVEEVEKEKFEMKNEFASDKRVIE
jgi:hypothetical protein